MTTRHEMAMAYIDQQKVLDVLRSIDEVDLVERLEQCMTARRSGITAWLASHLPNCGVRLVSSIDDAWLVDRHV